MSLQELKEFIRREKVRWEIIEAVEKGIEEKKKAVLAGVDYVDTRSGFFDKVINEIPNVTLGAGGLKGDTGMLVKLILQVDYIETDE